MKLSCPLGKQVVVGFSGGADSLALLVMLAKSFPVKAVHFNHGLRVESINEEDFCKSVCEKLNVPLEIIKLDLNTHRKVNESTEMVARRCRLEFWQTLPESVIALAHHFDDNQENFFIRLMRGSGSAGLCGMKEFSMVEGVNFWRPLLNYSKNELINYLRSNGFVHWCEDHTNHENIYRRNIIRNQLLPLYREIAGNDGGLRQSLKVLTLEDNYLDDLALNYYELVIKDNSSTSWLKIPFALLQRVLRLFLSDLLGYDFIPNFLLCQRVSDALSKHKSKITIKDDLVLEISNGIRLFVEKVQLPPVKILWDKFAVQFGNYEISWSNSTFEISNSSFSDEILKRNLVIRQWRAGDRIKCMNGMTKKLKKIFNDNKVAINDRDSWPIICDSDSGEIIWVPNLARSKYFLARKEDDCVIKMKIKLLL